MNKITQLILWFLLIILWLSSFNWFTYAQNSKHERNIIMNSKTITTVNKYFNDKNINQKIKNKKFDIKTISFILWNNTISINSDWNNPYVDLLSYLKIHKNNNILRNIISLFFVVTMSINMFITGGRAGQVGYFMMIILIVSQYFKKKIFKTTSLLLTLLPLIFYFAYNYSTIFKNRLDLAISNIKNYNKNANTSVGLRINFARNSWEIIKKHPIIGVGTGDFPSEYKKINQKLSPNVTATVQPHNMYILEMVQTGALGLLSLLYILYMQIKISLKKNRYYQIQQALPLLFAVIMFSDTYLLGHYTSLIFVYFSSFLYKDYSYDYQ